MAVFVVAVISNTPTPGFPGNPVGGNPAARSLGMTSFPRRWIESTLFGREAAPFEAQV